MVAVEAAGQPLRRLLFRPEDARDAPEVLRPTGGRLERRFTRMGMQLRPASLDRLFRLGGGSRLPYEFVARFGAMGLPIRSIHGALGRLRGLGDWRYSWSIEASRHEREARRLDSEGQWEASALSRRHAAMCHHAANLMPDTDKGGLHLGLITMINLYAQSVPILLPNTRKIDVPWRSSHLPAYLTRPEGMDERQAPLVVLLNGATTSKEELLLWAQPLLDEGLAVLALDWPGTGESSLRVAFADDCNDLVGGIVAAVRRDPLIDTDRIALLGVSVGGVVAVRNALDERVTAAVVVTPPFDSVPWLGQVGPLVWSQLLRMAGSEADMVGLARSASLRGVAAELQKPLLVIGAGRDLVIPPTEAVRLTEEAGELATLLWYGDAGHSLYGELHDWMPMAAAWLRIVLRGDESTRVEPVDTSSMWLEEADGWDEDEE